MTIATPDVELAPAAPARITAPPSQARVSEQSSPPSKIRHSTLMRRLVVSFSVLSVVFGVIVCLIVYSFLGAVIEKDVKGRADVIALGLREMAGPGSGGARTQELAAALDKYVSDDAVAYSYVENGKGEIVAHWPADLLRYLNRDFPGSAEQALNGADGEYRNLPIHEITKRIGDRNGGFVHLAIWQKVGNDEARRVTARIAAIVFAGLFGVTAVFSRVMRSLNRPFVEIVDHAERISKGDFDVPLVVQRRDEIGELARSLERMRSSLRAVTTRLEQVQLTEQSSK